MDARIWGQELARLNLVLHLLTGVLLLGATTHHLVLVLKGKALARRALVARYAFWATVAYLTCFFLGAILYPTYGYHVRYLYQDAAAPWATGLFEIKEHCLAVGLAILPFYYVSSRSLAKLNDHERRLHALSVSVLSGIVWYAFIIGAVLVNLRGV